MTCKPGVIVRVPFPFVDSAQTKHRPALILSSEEFSREHAHIVLAMITSAKHSRWPSDVVITDLSSAGLRVPSVVRFKIFTLDVRLVAPPLGRLSAANWKAVNAALHQILGGTK